jgi:hypothetical protein
VELFWELFQTKRINDATGRTTDVNERVTKSQAFVDHLTDRVERLTLINCALWEIIKSNHGLNDQMLADKMAEIDMRDGTRDGKIGSGPSACSKCGRNSSARHKNCIYCGNSIKAGPF